MYMYRNGNAFIIKIVFSVIVCLSVFICLCACEMKTADDVNTATCSVCGNQEIMETWYGGDGQMHGYYYCEKCGNKEREF